MTALQFAPMKNGAWIQPRRRGYLLQCCDCGLIHRLNFRLVTWRPGSKRHFIQFQAFRVEDNDDAHP